MTHDPRFDVPLDFRRQPLRVAVTVGFVITAVSSALPWIEGTSGFGGPVSFNGYVRSADGGFLATFGIVLVVLAMSRGAAEGSSAAVRLLPGLVGVVLVFLVVTAHLNAGTELRAIGFEGGEATTTVFFWLATGGALLMAAAGVALTLMDRVRRGPWFRAADLRLALRRQRLVPAAGAVVGAVAGFASVLFVGARTLESALVLAFVVAALIGAIGGGWLGYSVGRWLVLTPPDRRA
jgi:hypothetical protein